MKALRILNVKAKMKFYAILLLFDDIMFMLPMIANHLGNTENFVGETG